MKKRIYKLKAKIKKEQADGLLIFNLANIRYLTGYSGSCGLLFVSTPTLFITDFRYEEQVKKEVKGAKVFIAKKSLFDKLNQLVRFQKAKTILFESKHISYYEFMKLKKEAKGKRWRGVVGWVEEMREIKDKEEIEKIKQACEITVQVFKEILPLIKPGVKEIELAAEIDYRIKKNGAEKSAFETIVVSGEKSAMPHGKPGEKELRKGEFVTFDFGAVYQGYHSDFTRTIVIGKATPEQKKIYNIVKKAQQETIDQLREGMSCRDADLIARSIIEKEGYGKYFGHGLGHGVGLEVHEAPRLSYLAPVNAKLKKNSVVTVEPGIYLPNFGGVRIEDTVVIEEDKVEILTKFSKELIEI